jgi:transcriptional regulator with XRE-family HTH domain
LADPSRRALAAFSKRLAELRRSVEPRSQTRFAARLGAGWDQSKVSRIERGDRFPTDGELEAWASETGADPGELMAMRDSARAEHAAYATFRDLYAQAGGAAAYQDAIGEMERAAKRIGQYQPALVLGLLQTADYARELLHLEGGPAAHGASEDDIGHMIASRLRRQAIVHESGRQAALLMGEAALRARFASVEVMRGQCEHIARLAETAPAAVIGIVPFAAQIPVVAITGWSVTDDLVQIETEGGDLPIADPAEVERYWRYTQLMREVAMIRSDAAALCREIGESL